MRKICPYCGHEQERMFFVFRPIGANEIIADIKNKLPNDKVVVNAIEGNKIEIIFPRVLSDNEKNKVISYFTDKRFVEDVEEEERRQDKPEK